MIVAFVSSWTPAMITPIDSVERIDRSASLRTSAATTANPLPDSPARAASIAAFSASRFVCPEISLISSRISPIFCVPLTQRQRPVRDRLHLLLHVGDRRRRPGSAACRHRRHVSAIDPAVAASSSIVADVCATAADCSLVTAAAFLRRHPQLTRDLAKDGRGGADTAEEFVQPAECCRQVPFPVEGPAQQPERENAAPTRTARTMAASPIPSAWSAAEAAAASAASARVA